MQRERESSPETPIRLTPPRSPKSGLVDSNRLEGGVTHGLHQRSVNRGSCLPCLRPAPILPWDRTRDGPRSPLDRSRGL